MGHPFMDVVAVHALCMQVVILGKPWIDRRRIQRYKTPWPSWLTDQQSQNCGCKPYVCLVAYVLGKPRT